LDNSRQKSFLLKLERRVTPSNGFAAYEPAQFPSGPLPIWVKLGQIEQNLPIGDMELHHK
jgi:hypothetical protein